MGRKPETAAAYSAFAAILLRHMRAGTRPEPDDREPWTSTTLARVLSKSDAEPANQEGRVRAWRDGRSLPQEIQPLLRIFFGPLRSDGGQAREELRAAYNTAKEAIHRPALKKFQPDPVGEIIVPEGDGLAILRTPPDDDIAATANPRLVTDHPIALEQLREFIDLLAQNDNQLTGGFRKLADIAKRLLAALDVPIALLADPQRLASAYNASSRLAGFYDLHLDYIARPEPGESRLPGEVARELRDIRNAIGLMLRVFPSVQLRDGDLRDALRAEDVPAAKIIADVARQRAILAPDDLDAFDDMQATTELPGPQSARAKGRLVGSIRNTLGAAAIALVLNGYASVSPLVIGVSGFLASVEKQIGVIITGMAPDIAGAIQFAVERALHSTALAIDPEPAQIPLPPPSRNPRLIRFARWRDPIPGLSDFPSHEMITIGGPGESFIMGAPEREKDSNDGERPQRQVTVPLFGLAIDAVTFSQWDVALAAGANLPRPDDHWGRGDQPVINVSWYDAQAYCAWLNQRLQVDEGYRLPTEAEWEYACRAGTTTPFSFGETISTDQVNYDGGTIYGRGTKGEFRSKTISVDALGANKWGLRQMHGNVFEWVEDVASRYDADLTNGSLAVGGKSDFARVLRGGSWFDIPPICRSAYRFRYAPGNRSIYAGFRIARTPGRLPGLQLGS